MKIRIKSSGIEVPKYETKGSAGVDLMARIDETIVLKHLDRCMIPTGISIELPVGYEAQIRARSGLAAKYGVGLVNGIGTIDSDYRGEIKIILINWGKDDFIVEDGQRIAQMVIAKYETIEFELVEELDDTERGHGGFGHTGM